MTRQQLLPYIDTPTWQAAQLLGITRYSFHKWMKKFGFNTNVRYKRGELPGSLYQSMKAQGLDLFENMTAFEIADEFKVDPCHVRWAARRFGFEYRHLRRGRKKIAQGIHQTLPQTP